MTNKLHFYRDSENAPRAEGKDEDTGVLARFLESDIQDDSVTGAELLARVEACIGENDTPIDFVGNSFAVTFTSDTVSFSSHLADSEGTAMLDPHQVIMALKGWQAFIEE